MIYSELEAEQTQLCNMLYSCSVLRSGICISKIPSSHCGDVGHRIEAKYLASDACGRW